MNTNTNTDKIQSDSYVNRKDENPFVVLALKMFIIAAFVIVIVIFLIKVKNMNISALPFVVLASKLCSHICLKNNGFKDRKKYKHLLCYKHFSSALCCLSFKVVLTEQPLVTHCTPRSCTNT